MTTTTTRRALRSNTKLLNNNTTDGSAIMAPSKKREAAQTEKITCFTCAEEKSPGQFPDYNPSPDCQHLINTCKGCLRGWVETCIDEANFRTVPTAGEGEAKGGEEQEVWGIGCPQCESVMRAVNVQMAVPKKVCKRFEELERKHFAEITPNWRWCLASGCRAGQIYVPKDDQPQEAPQEPPAKRRKRTLNPFKKAAPGTQITDTDIMTCNTCSARSCARCDRPMHDGESCVAYQERIKDRLDEEDKALKAVQKFSRPCPGCGKNIQKNGGCPNMMCSQCRTNFCWNCLQKYQSGYCKCHPPPPSQRGL